MTKAELIDAVAAATNESKAVCDRVLDALGDQIRAQMGAKGELSLPGVGKFDTSERAARKGRNPQTGEELDIAATTVPRFKAAKALKDAAAGN